MTKDQLPWIPIAKLVLMGFYDEAPRSVQQAVAMGVRTINDPDCQAAWERLKESLPKTKQ